MPVTMREALKNMISSSPHPEAFQARAVANEVSNSAEEYGKRVEVLAEMVENMRGPNIRGS